MDAGPFAFFPWRSTSRQRGSSRASTGRPARPGSSCSRSSPTTECRSTSCAAPRRRTASPLVPVERVLGGGEQRYSAEEIAELTGLDQEFLERRLAGPRDGAGRPGREGLHRGRPGGRATGRRRSSDAGLPEDGHPRDQPHDRPARWPAWPPPSARCSATPTCAPGDDEQSLALRYAEASRELTPMLGPGARAHPERAAAQPDPPGGGGQLDAGGGQHARRRRR